MDIIEKIGDTITEKGKVAADKAKELAAIANLKSQISTCEEVMKKNYLEIGKIYFEQYSDMPEPPFEKQCETIKNSQRAIADLQEKRHTPPEPILPSLRNAGRRTGLYHPEAAVLPGSTVR